MKLEDADIKKKCNTFIQDAIQHTTMRDQRKRAERYQDFFRGGTHQWTQEEYDVYKSRGVEPITINRCKPVMKGLLGMYLQSKQEVKVRPRRNGSGTVAQVHTEIVKHAQDLSCADYVYAQVFMRGGIDTESYLKLEIDKTENVNGQPVIKGRSLWDVQVDRNATEYDLNESAKYVIDRQWKDHDELVALYPDREGEIKVAVQSIDDLEGRPSERLATYMTNEGASSIGDEDEGEQIPDIELLKKYRYLTQYVYWKEIKAALIVGDRQTGQTSVVSEEKKVLKLHRKGKKSKRFSIINYPMKILHETVMLGGAMIEDTPEPLGKGISDFPIVRYSPMWDMGYAIGVLDDVVSLNKEENIHRTQAVRIVNQTANSGWVVGDTNNKPYVKTLANFGSVPGIIVDKKKLGDFVQKIVPNPVPQGHVLFGQQFEQDIKRVSGVDDASHGYETGKAESGRAINLKLQSNRSANEIFFDNFYHTLEIFGNLMLQVNIATDVYTDEEIKRIVDESSMLDAKLLMKAKAQLTAQLMGADLPEPQPLPPIDPGMMMAVRPEDQGQFMAEIEQGTRSAQQYAKMYPQLAGSWEEVIRDFAEEMLLDELREDKGRYGVKVTVSPSAPTERIAQFLQMDALMTKYGNLIPPDIFIDLTDLPNKEEIKARLAQAQQAQQQQQMPGAAAA
jgi:hypothetical protein